jgi:putative transposase
VGLAESTYYADPKVSRKERDKAEADIRGKIEQIRVEFPRTGYRMLLAHLKGAGVKIGERKLRRILTKFGLQFQYKKRFVATTDSNHPHEIHPNLIEELAVTGVNQVYTADITYSTPSRSGPAGCRKERTSMNGMRMSTKGGYRHSTALCYERARAEAAVTDRALVR